MKKRSISAVCVLLCFLMCVPCAALASGLDGLFGGLPDIQDLQNTGDGDPGVLPDPAELLGEDGTLYAEDYNFAPDFVGSVYTYDLPDDGFLEAYTAQAEANGFTVTETTVEDYAAYSLENDGLTALLLPDYEGLMMLMVENGMVFGEPLPDYYVRMTYNGRDILTDKMEFMRSYDAYQYKFEYFDFEKDPSHMQMRFPKSMSAGDDYTWTPDSTPEYLYLSVNDILLDYQSFTRMGEWGGSDDFFQLKIVTKEETPQGLVIEGRFSGILDYASITIENGSFRILVK